MSKTFAAASVALSALLAPAAALAFNAPPAPAYRTGPGPHGPAPVMAAPRMAALPDFPAEARPGECWTRTPVGAGAPMGVAPAGQPVWTLKRGHGPEAVWRFDRRPVDGAMAGGFDGPYQWVRVACSPNDPTAFAEAPPAPPAPPVVEAPAAPPPPPHHGGMAQGPMPHGPMHHGGMHQGQMHHGPMHQGPGPMAHGPMHHGPGPMAHGPMTPPHGPMLPAPGPYAGVPMPEPFPPAYAPPPAPPRWFGDRFLTWSGKTGW